MPTETGTIDLKAQKDAAKVATDYITEISQDGIWVTPSDAKPSSGSAVATTSGWHISDAIELFKSGVSYIKMWVESNVAKLRLGATTSTHVIIDNDSLDIEDGNQTPNKLATFGSNGATIGKNSESHLDLDYHSMQLVDSEQSSYMHISDVRNAQGIATISERIDLGASGGSLSRVDLSYLATEIVSLELDDGGYVVDTYTTLTMSSSPWNYTRITISAYHHAVDPGDDMVPAVDPSIVNVTYKTTNANTKVYTLGERNANSILGAYSYAFGYDVESSGLLSHAEGLSSTAANRASHAEGEGTAARGMRSHAEGENTEASYRASHAEGSGTMSSGYASHAEGVNSVATGQSSHAEGHGSIASAYAAHAEGSGTASYTCTHAEGSGATASGYAAHAEGQGTTASGYASHAQNLHTTASSEYQTTLGKYNISDTDNTYAIIVGNGAVSNLSNALTLDWSGNAWLAGNITLPNNYVYVKHDTIDTAETGNNVSGTTYSGAVGARDRDDRWYGFIQADARTDGKTNMTIAARNQVLLSGASSRTSRDNSLTLGIEDNGTRTVTVSDQDAWRIGLGFENTLTLGTNTSGEENGIKIKGGGSRNQYALRVISASNGDGDAVLLGDGGLTIIGAGEAAPNLWTDLNTSAGSENLHLAADSNIYLQSNCQTIASRKTATYDTSGNLTIPAKIVASKLEPPTRTTGVSYIAGANGDASVYTKKSTGNVWSPAICLDTTSGGSWQIGNYNNENLQFVWASKANRDSSTNTTTAVNLPNTAGTISLQPVYYSASSATQVNVTDTSKFRFLVILFRTNSTTYTGNGTSADSSPLNSTMVHINNKSSGNVYASLIGGHQVSSTMMQFRMGIATVACSTTAGKVTLSKQMYCNIDTSSQAVASNTDMALVGVVGIY